MSESIVDYQPPTMAAWLEERRKGVGASEVPALLGVDPYLSPFALWAEKTGRVSREIGNAEAAFWGTRLEPLVCSTYAERTGRDLIDHGRTAIRRGEHPVLFATLDREIVAIPDGRGSGALEAKAPGYLQRDAWESGPPLRYQVQLQAQLAVTGFQWGAIAALIGGQDFRAYDLERNAELIDVIHDAVDSFWCCVRDDVPPDVDGSEATREALKRLYPEDSGAEVDLPPEAVAWAASIEQAKAELKKWREVESEAKNRLLAAIGSATVGRLGDLTFTAKTIRKAPYTVAAQEYRELRRKETKR